MVSGLWFQVSYLLLLHKIGGVQGGFGDYLTGLARYFGGAGHHENGVYDTFTRHVPYEVSELDEKFISDAVKLTGVALSELDSCQQRVVLKLKSDCGRMNDEELAKMAVHLLNCQSYVEGRTMYPCSEEMSIKQCTIDMDSDTWTSYHLMSNRARAVCYTVRHAQFRGLAEHTVNRLMEAAQNQLISLDRITTNQENILDLAETTYQSLFNAQTELANQQTELQRAQLHGQLTLEDNIMRLVDEKRIIRETHDKLVEMTREIQNRLENSAKMIVDQGAESKTNHKQLIDDVITVQTKANELFNKIDSYSEILLKQNAEFKQQYDATLQNLREVNETVHNLVNLIGRTRQGLEERLSWIVTALGGTDKAVERLYLVLLHLGFVLMSMLTCSFLSTEMTARFFVVALPAANLTVALYGRDSLTFPGLIATVAILLFARNVINWTVGVVKRRDCQTSNSRKRDCQTDDDVAVNDDVDDRFEYSYSSPTPPESRNGHYPPKSRSVTPLRHKVTCRGVTRAGTPCKMTSLVGRDFCYRHQHGDSILE